jgi:hypothetical protein
MQEKDGTCYLCIRLHNNYRLHPLEEHHVFFGTANRKLSEKYGMKVYLCHEHHNTYGYRESVHHNAKLDRWLKEIAQEAFEERYPDLDFREIFGKNYLDRCKEGMEPDAAGQEPCGFIPIEGIEDDLPW